MTAKELSPLYYATLFEERELRKLCLWIKERWEGSISHLSGEQRQIEKNSLEWAETYSPFSLPRLLILEGIENFSSSSLLRVLEYAKDPLPDTHFLLLAFRAPPSQSSLVKSHKHTSFIIFLSIPNALPWKRHQEQEEFLEIFCREKKWQLSSELFSLLKERIGEQREEMEVELHKLALYLGERREIKREDLVILFSRRERENWKWVSEFLHRKFLTALSSLAFLLQREEQWLFPSLSLLRTLLQQALLLSSSCSGEKDPLLEEKKLSLRKREDLRKLPEKMGEDWVRRALILLFQLELSLKSGATESKHASLHCLQTLAQICTPPQVRVV